MLTQVKCALALFAALMVLGLTMSFTATYRNTGTIITAVIYGLGMEVLKRYAGKSTKGFPHGSSVNFCFEFARWYILIQPEEVHGIVA